jgi:cytidine deaminase
MSGPPADDHTSSSPRRSLSGEPPDQAPEGRPRASTRRAPELAERLLYQEALDVSRHAYAPYSGFAVGAVAVGPSGRSHHGVNVENAAYPAGLCAERAALAALVAFGERGLRYVAVAARDGSDCAPCGLCLQALAEFGDPEVVMRSGGELEVVHLRELLTAPFSAPGEGEAGG